jgi:hypothetical protein
MLRTQFIKHTVWLVVDGAITLVAVMFFWVLVPIPGPNVFFYYPALRLASHYRAMTGARRALGDAEVAFAPLPELERLEEKLKAGDTPKTGCASAGVRVAGLDTFLQRVM